MYICVHVLFCKSFTIIYGVLSFVGCVHCGMDERLTFP